MTTAAQRPLRVFIACAGLGHVQRGFETFARNCFEALSGDPALDLWLIKGAGRPSGRERVAPALRRGHVPARALARLVRRDDYRIECASYAAAMVPELVRRRPDVVFATDWPVVRALAPIRAATRLRFAVLLHNGAAGWPPFPRGTDHVHQPTPDLLRVGIDGGEPAERQSMVPLGVPLERNWSPPDEAERRALRGRLGLPAGRRVVLSVAALNNWSKRLDYLIGEVASLPEAERPFLALVGQREAETDVVLRSAYERLGENGFAARAAAPAEVRDWYRAADVFVLASTTEGFGLVLLEASAEGLPCICHDYPATRFVLGEHGRFGDLRRQGVVAGLLAQLGDDDLAAARRQARRAWVRDNFSWDVLAPRYAEMLHLCAAGQTTTPSAAAG